VKQKTSKPKSPPTPLKEDKDDDINLWQQDQKEELQEHGHSRCRWREATMIITTMVMMTMTTLAMMMSQMTRVMTNDSHEGHRKGQRSHCPNQHQLKAKLAKTGWQVTRGRKNMSGGHSFAKHHHGDRNGIPPTCDGSEQEGDGVWERERENQLNWLAFCSRLKVLLPPCVHFPAKMTGNKLL
jgi:hypothetical protein